MAHRHPGGHRRLRGDSGDHQWIFVDTERAKAESPYGTTIAHGNLTLSMIDGFRQELISSSGFALDVNYGWNRPQSASLRTRSQPARRSPS
jgi:MaoC like domain